MKINILLCDTFPGLLPDYIPTYFSMFSDLFASVRSGIHYTIFPCHENVFPDKFCRNELYLITGSNAGVYEDKEWIRSLFHFIHQADAEKVPLTGICFGHQAIAQALGGKVIRSPKGWGTGIRVSELTGESAFRYFPSGRLALHYNHHDQVVKLPTGAVNFASSDFCEYEGFTIGNHILTFQGHPEYTDAYNRHLLINHSAEEPERVKQKGLESIGRTEAMGKEVARWILDFKQDFQ